MLPARVPMMRRAVAIKMLSRPTPNPKSTMDMYGAGFASEGSCDNFASEPLASPERQRFVAGMMQQIASVLTIACPPSRPDSQRMPTRCWMMFSRFAGSSVAPGDHGGHSTHALFA
jgi:hypothetical protein